MISRYFTHSLNVVKYYNSPRQYNFFLTRKESVVLNEVLNRFVDALTNEVRYEVSQKIDLIQEPGLSEQTIRTH